MIYHKNLKSLKSLLKLDNPIIQLDKIYFLLDHYCNYWTNIASGLQLILKARY